MISIPRNPATRLYIVLMTLLVIPARHCREIFEVILKRWRWERAKSYSMIGGDGTPMTVQPTAGARTKATGDPEKIRRSSRAMSST